MQGRPGVIYFFQFKCVCVFLILLICFVFVAFGLNCTVNGHQKFVTLCNCVWGLLETNYNFPYANLHTLTGPFLNETLILFSMSVVGFLEVRTAPSYIILCKQGYFYRLSNSKSLCKILKSENISLRPTHYQKLMKSISFVSISITLTPVNERE